MAGQTINVSVLADTRQFSSAMKGVSRSLEFEKLGQSMKDIGGGLQGVGRSLTKYVTAPALGAAAAVGGITAALGWKRLVGLDTAKGQLKGLGYEGKKLDKIMAGVDKGVTDTTLSMADGAGLMVGALATGNLTLDETESYLKRVANVSAAYNVDAQHAGLLLNNVLTKNKVTWGDLSQMQENSIPIVTALADHYGVAGDEIMKMAQDGKISVEDLNEVLDKNAGQAAKEYSKTWAGVTANIKSNIGKIGAALLGPSFDKIKERAQGFLDLLRSPEWKQRAEDIGESIGNALDRIIEGIEDLVDWWKDLDDGTKDNILRMGAFVLAAGPVLVAIGSLASGLGGVVLWLSQMAQAFGAFKAALAVVAGGPIAWTIAAIAALVGGLALFFTQTETGREMWGRIWPEIQAIAEGVSAWFTDTFLPAMQDVWEKVKGAASDFAAWMDEHVGPVVEAAGEVVVAVAGRIEEAWNSLVDLASQVDWDTVWDNIAPALQAAWDTVVLTLETGLAVLAGVLSAGADVIEGDWDSAMSKLPGITEKYLSGSQSIADARSRTIAHIMAAIGTGISSAWEETWSAVKLATSLYLTIAVATVRAKIDDAVHFVSTLPTRALAALGAVGTVLWNAGYRLIGGFIDGMRSRFPEVTGALQSLTAVIPLYKGPPAKDRVLLRGAGQLIIKGLIEGMESQYAAVETSLGGLTTSVAGTRFQAPAMSRLDLGADTGAGASTNYVQLSPEAERALLDARDRPINVKMQVDRRQFASATLQAVQDFDRMGTFGVPWHRRTGR